MAEPALPVAKHLPPGFQRTMVIVTVLFISIMATIDPELIRAAARVQAGLFQIDGYALAPLERTVANGRRFIDYHAGITVRAIEKALAERP